MHEKQTRTDCLPYAPPVGTGLRPRRGIKPAAFRFAGRCPTSESHAGRGSLFNFFAR